MFDMVGGWAENSVGIVPILQKKDNSITQAIKQLEEDIKTKKEPEKGGQSLEDPVTTYWYPLKRENQLQYEIKGPASVRVFTRIEFDNGDIKEDYYIRIREDGYDLGTYYFESEPSGSSSVAKTGKTVGKWRTVWLNIPKGKHYYTLTLPDIDDNFNKTVYIRLKEWKE